MVKEMRHSRSGIELADGVEARIGAYGVEHTRIVVADRAIMELLCPVVGGVHFSTKGKEAMLELANLQCRQAHATHGLGEDGLNL